MNQTDRYDDAQAIPATGNYTLKSLQRPRSHPDEIPGLGKGMRFGIFAAGETSPNGIELVVSDMPKLDTIG